MIWQKSSLGLAFLFIFQTLTAAVYAEASEFKLYSIAEVRVDGGANIRSGLDPKSAVKSRALKGDSFAVQSVGDRFFIVDGPNAGGFIAKELVQLQDMQYPVGICNASQVRLRNEPSKTSKSEGSLPKNMTVAVKEIGSWFQIKDGFHRGKFIGAEYIKPIDAPKIPEANELKTSEANSNETKLDDAKAQGTALIPKVAPVSEPSPIKAPAWDDKTEQRFQDEVAKAFKSKSKKSAEEDVLVLMPVFNDVATSSLGYINTRVHANKTIDLDSDVIFKLLKTLVIESWFLKPEIAVIVAEANKNGAAKWVALSSFKNTGIEVNYNESKIEIRLVVPPNLRASETSSLLKSQRELDLADVESPAFFSSYLNVNANEIFDSRNVSVSDKRAPLRLQFENGTRVGDYVLEANGTYVEDRGTMNPNTSPFNREDFRVVKDFPKELARGSVGDVLYPVQDFQVYRPMQGVAFSSQFSLNPSKLTYPSGNYEIYLKQNSKVYIWVNDQMQKVLTLPAGRHEIKDFPYTNGVNNLRFEIVDEFGQSETLNYSYFSSSELLKEKLHQYAYAAGRPAIAAPLGGKEYNDNTTFTGFHRYGFNNYFTGGLNFQRDNYQTIVGGDALWSTKIGFVKIEPAVSLNTVSGNGLAVRTRYSYVDYKGPQKTQRLFNAGLTVQSPQFSTLGNLSTAGSKTLYGLSSSYTRGISKSMSANMGASYNINNKALAGVENSFLLTGGLSNRWENGVSVNVSASHTKSEGGKDDLGISLFLLWSFPEEKQVISAVKNTSDNSSRVDWNYSPSTGADSASYSATIRENDSEKGYAGLVSFNGNRVRATAGHEVLLESTNSSTAVTADNQRAANITTLQAGSSFVYTRGRFAIGRPITDSFAIVAPVKSLKGRRLEINPDSDENYVAKSDWLGPAVASELGSYNISSIVVAGRDLPVGISLPKDHFSIYPTYKSGYSFELGTDANIYLIGLLKLPDGKPASMIAGQAMNVDDPSQPPITLFTSRKGQIRSEGFRTGRFVLEVDTEKYEPLEFSIPESAKEEFDIGVLQLRVKGDRSEPEKAPVIEQKVEPNEVPPELKPTAEPVPQANPEESPQDTNVPEVNPTANPEANPAINPEPNPETNPVTSPESDIINEDGGVL